MLISLIAQYNYLILILIEMFISSFKALILSGDRESFVRFPKWAQTFENEIKFEFKTKQSNSILIYTDDGAINHNFLIISIIENYILVEFKIGENDSINTLPKRQNIYLTDTKVNDGKWHYFSFFQAWENIKIQIDKEIKFRLLEKQKSFALGNIRTNSDMFIGGIPKDVEKLSAPLRRYSKRFAGSIRNLMYRIYPQGMAAPLMIDSFGTRKTDDNYCLGQNSKNHKKEQTSKNELNFCYNSGICYSANNGPRCDCFFSDYEGRKCENKKPSTEVSFFGNEWLGYDITQMEKLFENNNNINEDPDLLAVWSHREIFNISFRTNFSKNAILFVAGDSKSNLKLTIEKGELLTTHQLENTDKRFIRVQDLAQRMPLRFDDNAWHSICIIREIHSIRLIVDNVFDQQVKQFTPQLEWLGNSFFYIGGVPQTLSYLMPSDYLLPFRGCLKNIFFQSGPIEINLIQLADQGFGQSNVQTFGDIVFSCMPSAQNAPLIFSFNNGNNYTKLPAWRSPSRGNLAFQFRTLTPDGLLLYHGMLQCKNFTICDYLAFELINGHLFVN